MKHRYLIYIRGTVQGVGYRVFIKSHADQYGVFGFVRNEPNGSVLIDAEGEEEMLEVFMALCEEGPPTAIIESLEFSEVPLEGFVSFVISRKW